jgi:hypothetical protein
MEATSDTSSGSAHTPISTVTGGGVMPPPPPPPIKAMDFYTPMTSGSGTIPSRNLTIIPSIQNVSSAPFLYGMPGLLRFKLLLGFFSI